MKEIITVYKEITGYNLIDENSILSTKGISSIKKDRLISAINDLGYNWNGKETSLKNLFEKVETNINSNNKFPIENSIRSQNSFIGLDIQHYDELPEEEDYWESKFYRDVFKESEIAYALSKENPRTTLTGIFSAKEAIYKANNSEKIKEIEIKHDGDIPFHDKYYISISHSGKYAISVAIIKDFIENISNLHVEKITPRSVSKSGEKTKKELGLFRIFTIVIIVNIISWIIYNMVIEHI